ncbi:hypothetical protein E1B28_010021 [Marasmius oreades]|nr:uncharacterized protein E1B28_010021 [Marasmius oreades]KAG7090951.1 hypothetical protein E1B28_010021 [Marasmius oreades]
MEVSEDDNQRPNNSGVIHIIRDLRGPITNVSCRSPAEQPHILDDLEYLQNGQPFVGTDEYFHAEGLDLDGSSFVVEEEEDSTDVYPCYIMRAASLLETPSSTSSGGIDGVYAPYHPRQFYHFWKLIMSFFFPPPEGYTCQYDWLDPAAQSMPTSSPLSLPTSLVVLRDYSSQYRHRRCSVPNRGSCYPVALIQIFSPLDFNNGLLRETAARQTLDQFEALAPYTNHETLLVVSAMGKAWRAWQKDSHFTEEEVRRWGLTNNVFCRNSISRQEGQGGMRDSEWMEDVSSEVGRDVLSRMCEDIKRQFRPVPPRRRVDRRGRRLAL